MTGILDTLKALVDTQGDAIEAWFAGKRRGGAPYLYTSVDLRHSGLKLAPVDTNLFPAGFNNLSMRARARAARFLARSVQEQWPEAKRILIIPENHTRNMGYLENLAVLCALFEDVGYEVRLGSLAAQKGEPIKLTAPSGAELVEEPLVGGEKLATESGFVPDVVVMNNDMTAGAPEILKGIAQPVVPTVCRGWWMRRKSVHFAAYRELVDDFCARFGLDSWLLAAEFHACGMVNFKESGGMDCVAKGVDEVLAKVRGKYAQYGITQDPYVFVKADSGTYGMGIMTVRDGSEMLELNKKERNKMQVIKEGTVNSEVIIQEGVPTIDTVDGNPAEPMVYIIDGVPIGGMYRVNSQRDAFNNLNAAGMSFTGMCDEGEPDPARLSVQGCHFRAYGIVAALAALAAAREDYSHRMADKLKLCS